MTAHRICLLSAEYPPAPGGVGDYTACLAAALTASGREVHILTSAGPRPESGEAPGVEVHRVVTDWRWAAWPQVARVLRDIRPDVVDIQYQTGAYRLHGAINLLPWRLRRLPGLAWVTTFHDLREPYLFPKAGPVRGWANHLLMRGSRAFVVTNPQDAAALPRWARRRAVGIPIGANVAPAPPTGWDRTAERSRWGAGPETTLIAYFGFFNAAKGIDVLLAALAALCAAGDHYRLLLVGGGTGETDPTNADTAASMRTLIAAAHLEPLVRWTGYLSAAGVSAALLSADIAALPYLDGASLRRGSLLAVLAHGLPTVTTRPAPAPEAGRRWPALRDGENVLLVPPGDALALAAALARLAADPALRDRLRGGARALASQFSWDRIAARHLALFDRLAP